MRALVILVAAVLALGSNVSDLSALPQRGAKPPSRATPPAGAEIAAAARAARLDTANVGTATLFGKPFKFTPVQVPTEKDASDATKGSFVGVLENGAPGDETGLPVGKYNLFVANVAGQWKCYAEANGQIVREAIRTTVTDAQPGAKAPPRFTEKGWCVRVYRCRYQLTLEGVIISCFWTITCF